MGDVHKDVHPLPWVGPHNLYVSPQAQVFEVVFEGQISLGQVSMTPRSLALIQPKGQGV